METIEDIFKMYMELEKENATLDKKLQEKNQAYEEFTNSLSQDIVTLFNNQALRYKEYQDNQKFFKKERPINFSIVIVLNFILQFIIIPGGPVFYGIPSLIIAILIYLFMTNSDVQKRKSQIAEYESNERKLKSYNADVLDQLRLLKNEVLAISSKISENEKRISDIKKNFFETLSRYIEAEYQRLGIDDEVVIEEASIIANTKNKLELKYKRGNKND